MIAAATGTADVRAVAQLLRDYGTTLGIDLSFQHFEEELSNLPGSYAAPDGTLLLARSPSGDAAGCVAVRGLPQPGYCEMKRLYVCPAQRGCGLGRALAMRAVGFAQAAGHTHMRLDTLSAMDSAHALYRSLGFCSIPPYYDNPSPDVLYFERQLLPHNAVRSTHDCD